MDYEKTIEFGEDVEKAFDVAKSTFLPHGFQIVSISDTDLEVAGPGTYWTKGQDPMVGISKAHISAVDGKLSIRAELGGVTKAVKYLVIFIVAMAVLFLAVFAIVFGQSQGQSMRKVLLISLGPLAPWVVIAPLMGRFLKSRTCRAIDVLMNNIVALGKKDSDGRIG